MANELLRKVPARYQQMMEVLLTEYAQAVRLIDQGPGSVTLELEFSPTQKLSWHYLAAGQRELREGAAPASPAANRKTGPVLLHISGNAAQLMSALNTKKSIREVVFAANLVVRGNVDFAMRFLSVVEQVRSVQLRKGG